MSVLHSFWVDNDYLFTFFVCFVIKYILGQTDLSEIPLNLLRKQKLGNYNCDPINLGLLKSL